MATYSKVPIEAYHGLNFRDSYNSYSCVDITLQGRKLRVYNLHLESYQLAGESGGFKQRAAAAFKKLRSGIQKRSEQAE